MCGTVVYLKEINRKSPGGINQWSQGRRIKYFYSQHQQKYEKEKF